MTVWLIVYPYSAIIAASIVLYIKFFAVEMFENGDTLIKGMTCPSPKAGLGLDFLHWPETGCRWTILDPLLWPSRGHLLDCDNLQTSRENSLSSVQTGHNNAIIMQHIHSCWHYC